VRVKYGIQAIDDWERRSLGPHCSFPAFSYFRIVLLTPLCLTDVHHSSQFITATPLRTTLLNAYSAHLPHFRNTHPHNLNPPRLVLAAFNRKISFTIPSIPAPQFLQN
jgi:hypothetical protein